LVSIYKLNYAQEVIMKNDDLNLFLESKAFSQTIIHNNKKTTLDFCLIELIKKNKQSTEEVLLWNEINLGHRIGEVNCDVVADFIYSETDAKIYLILAQTLSEVFYIYKIDPNTVLKKMSDVVYMDKEEPSLSKEEEEKEAKMFTQSLYRSQEEKQVFRRLCKTIFCTYSALYNILKSSFTISKLRF